MDVAVGFGVGVAVTVGVGIARGIGVDVGDGVGVGFTARKLPNRDESPCMKNIVGLSVDAVTPPQPRNV